MGKEREMSGFVAISPPVVDSLSRLRRSDFQGRIESLPHHGRKRRWLSVATAIATLVSFSVPASAGELPSGVEAAGQTDGMTLHAQGVQIYECKAVGGGALAWKFREPLATLIHDDKTMGRHFAGPGWELTDGSGVTGKVEARAAGKTAHDVAWLRLDVVRHTGSGVLSDVTAVQRINTHGGVFSGSCDQAGAVHLEPYSADYVFLKGPALAANGKLTTDCQEASGERECRHDGSAPLHHAVGFRVGSSATPR